MVTFDALFENSITDFSITFESPESGAKFLKMKLCTAPFEPLMAAQSPGSMLIRLFGEGKGSGAACFFAVLWVLGLAVSLLMRKDPAIWALEKQPGDTKGACL